MNHEPQEPIRRHSRRSLAYAAASAGLATALAGAGIGPAFSTNATGAPVDSTPLKIVSEKLGAADADLLAEAEADGAKTVTLMIATAPGATNKVAEQLNAVKGGSVGRVYDRIGYVRATLPTSQAKAAIDAAVKLPSVHGIDLKHEIELDDPTPAGDHAKDALTARTASLSPAPNSNTSAKNPYNPSFETGAVEFVRNYPQYDGRGVTIGILDSGVDLGHPALRTTTTGERKVVDWVTATDPITDNDGTWRPQTTSVTGPVFNASGSSWNAPAGNYRFSRFTESITANGDMKGDVNRDGDTTDVFGLLYDPATGTVRVDTDQDNDFTDSTPMKPYKDAFQIGYFGTDNPATQVAERIPFVIEIRKDVPMDPLGGDWVGRTADFVNVGIIESEHGTHVAGITAARSLFGGRMNGAAPGAKLVSSRACTWSGGCTNVALTEGMADLVINRGVDIVNMSIGGLPALNDGNNARAELYTRLIDEYGVQLVISAGNEGPGTNTIGDPGLADKVISVGAAISKETWASNYGSAVQKNYAMFPFSSRGPREDGGFAPTLSAPGAAVNTIQTWLPGAPVKEAGYELPAGYGMLQGTSMASPQAAGAAALLLSAAKQRHMELTPAELRTALTSTAKNIENVQAHEQGAGLINITGAWSAIEDGATAHEYTVRAPVDTAIDEFLKSPGAGTGIYDREGGLKIQEKRTYTVTVTRTTGPSTPVRHDLRWKYNDGTFFRPVPASVELPLNTPVTVKVDARAATAGIHSAILELDDPATPGVDRQILSTVVVSRVLAKPAHGVSIASTVQRNSHKSYFVTVPEGAKTLEVALSGLKDESQTRFISVHPYGVAVEDSSSIFCYPNYSHPDNTCRPDVRSYSNPQPGVWEIEVESRRTSPWLDNPFRLDITLLGTAFDPEVKTLPQVRLGAPTSVNWDVRNNFAGLEGKLKGGPLGSAKVSRPEIDDQDVTETTVNLPSGVDRFDVAIGGVSDTAADLDLEVWRGTELIDWSADGDSDETVTLDQPTAGTYTIRVIGYSVPAGSTAYDYKDVYFAPSLGSVNVDEAQTIRLANNGTSQVAADVVVASPAPAGRRFFGEVQLVNARGTAAGTGSVVIENVMP
ncbi:S8 family serine peptidase [Streptomyces sp. NPDC056480]|uniref:S8 family serine peptidase n=1 Tax=Streptomyces sp. NPDC056480 TaxID=3345833 RepID=UPI00368C60EF